MKKQSPENSVNPPQLITFDAIMPSTMAVRVEESGVKKAITDPITLFALSGAAKVISD
jgi:hypothetical protein